MNEIHLSNAESCNYCRYFVRAQRAHKGLTKGSSNILPLPDRKLQPLAGEISWTKNLMALELKIGEFEPEYIGEMQFYLAPLDTQMKEEGENPSIGIILCKEKSRTIVEYALRDASRPIGIVTYRIVSELPRELEGQIPGPDEISRLLEGI
ncbi:YhcG PDDEXK nuclease domain protein [anaerobic digester metagenome]